MGKKYFIPLFLIFLIGPTLCEERVHIVREGDTLWDISIFYYTDPFLWYHIYKTNIPQIDDPHWIYPGQSFTIPPKPELEFVPTVAEEETPPVIPEETYTTIEEMEAVVEEYEVYEEFLEEEIIASEVKKQVEQITAIEIRGIETSIVPPGLVSRAGYIQSELPEGGYTIESEPTKVERVVSQDEVYINRGEDDGVHKEDFYTIFRIGDEIKHPVTGKKLGRLVKILGKLKVLKTEDKSSRCRVTNCYDFIKVMDRIKPYKRPDIPVNKELEATTERLEGYIVARDDKMGILFTSDIVYIDIGEANGAKLGDVFEIYRKGRESKDVESGEKIELSDVKVGVLQIIKLKENTSTCYIKSIEKKTDVDVGETIRLIARFEE